MQFPIRQVAQVLNTAAPAAGGIGGWSVDTRTLATGDCFFALRGPAHDGHDYVAQAFNKGAAAAVVDHNTGAPGPQLIVRDTQRALETLASWARGVWNGDVIGVTGSAGKTSTKDTIAALLASEIAVGKTTGNFNNHVGLPLSILRLPADARAAVLELGMNHAGEIRALSAIARPRIGVVTNVGYAHIEAFDSIDGIALAKRELIEALPADGIAVLNADDVRVARFAEIHPGRVIRFGIASETADIRAEAIEPTPEGARFRVGETRFETRLSGRHAILNILAGIAVARIYDIPATRLTGPVRELQPGKMRGERLVIDGITILNDCYNANPDAVRAMIDVLHDTPAARRIAVLGEMRELGRWSEPLHREAGRYAAACGIDLLLAVGGDARAMIDGAIAAGMPPSAASFFEDAAGAGARLQDIARKGDVILFKGSRGTRVERALEAFMTPAAPTGAAG